MCADGAIHVPDRILLANSVLSDSLPPTGVLLGAPLVVEGLPYIRPQPVIPVGPPVQ